MAKKPDKKLEVFINKAVSRKVGLSREYHPVPKIIYRKNKNEKNRTDKK